MHGFGEVRKRRRRIGSECEHLPAMVGGPQMAGRDIVLPEAHIGGGSSDGHALFAVAQSLLRLATSAALDEESAESNRLQGEGTERDHYDRFVLLPNRRLAKEHCAATWH